MFHKAFTISQEQKKSFLAQLATISKMSKEEINEVVENAVNGKFHRVKYKRKMAFVKFYLM